MNVIFVCCFLMSCAVKLFVLLSLPRRRDFYISMGIILVKLRLYERKKCLVVPKEKGLS